MGRRNQDDAAAAVERGSDRVLAGPSRLKGAETNSFLPPLFFSPELLEDQRGLVVVSHDLGGNTGDPGVRRDGFLHGTSWSDSST